MNSIETTALHKEAALQKRNLVQIVTGLFISPLETVKHIVEPPKLLFPFLIIFLSPYLIMGLRYPLYVSQLRKAVQNMGSGLGGVMTPGQIDSKVEQAIITGFFSAPAVAVISWLVITCIIFVFVKALDGKGTFRQYLAITGYSGFFIFINYLIVSVSSFFTGQLELDLSLGKLSDILLPGLDSFFYGMLKGVSVFSIWQYAIIGIGIGYIAKLGKVKAYAVTAAIFAITLLYLGAGEYASSILTAASK